MPGSTNPPKQHFKPKPILKPCTKIHQDPWTSLWTPLHQAPSNPPSLPAPAPAIYFTFPPLLTVSDLGQISGEDALDPLMQLQQNLAALNQATIIICLISIKKIRTTDICPHPFCLSFWLLTVNQGFLN